MVQIIQDSALLLRLRKPGRVTNVIPKSKEIRPNEVLVNWGLDEAKVLKNMGIDAPAPILKRYNWPGMFPPYEHQKETAAFLSMNQKAFNFGEQGTGKTFSAIWAADYLMTLGKVNRVLVICPLSIMDAAWRADLFKAAMHRRVDIAHGTADKRKKIIASNAEFIIINYDGVSTVYDDLENGGFDLIIMDEATYMKNPSTRRWKFINGLIKPDTWVWMLTGTPAAQSPVDAYGLAKIINPSSVPRSKTLFQQRVMLKISNFKWVPKKESTDIVHQALQPAIRHTKEECLDLPEQVYMTRDIPLTPQQAKYYKTLKDDMLMQAAGEAVTSANAAVNLNKLLQLSAGALYTDDKEVLEFDISNRFTALKDVINETKNKVLVFAPFRHIIGILQEKLEGEGIATDVIHGGISSGKRSEVFASFQDTDKPRVLVIQPQAAAHGVTLTAADTIVWWGPTSSLEIYAQANARIHRSGQVNRCTVIHLQGSFVERYIYKMLSQRIDVHTNLIDLYKDMLE